MASRAEARHQRMLQHLSQVADMYRTLREAGSTTPAQQIADHHHVTGATARSWIHRARQHGLLGDPQLPAHRPRRVDWGKEVWTACITCRVEWPCSHSNHPQS